jgi:phenylacetate-CoA ligase
MVCPLHELLLRRPTFARLRELEWSQWTAPADLHTAQQHRLAALLRHAGSRTEFYRRRFFETGLNPADIRPESARQALSALPLLDKATIRVHRDEMRWPGAPGGLFAQDTGGSTGEPLRFFFDRRRQACDQAARIRTHRWFGADVGDRELYLWGSPIEWTRTDRVKRFRDRLFNHRLLNAFEMSPPRMDAYLDELERYRPSCVFGYPSSLALLADHARRRGRRPSVPGLRAVFVTGEVCLDDDRRSIAEAFGVPVADGYGSREGGFVAHECPAGGFHVMNEHVVVEIVRDGVPVPDGEEGEIVLTHLEAYGMPFIRYRTGDVACLSPGRCACGRGLPLMGRVQGRSTDLLRLPDGTVRHALSIIYPLRAMEGVRQFRVVQEADFSTTVEVVLDQNRGAPFIDQISKAVRPVVGPGVALRVVPVDHILPGASGKHRYVVSHVPAEQPGARRECPSPVAESAAARASVRREESCPA